MMGTPGKGDKSAIQNSFNSNNDGFISTSNLSEQKEQTNTEK